MKTAKKKSDGRYWVKIGFTSKKEALGFYNKIKVTGKPKSCDIVGVQLHKTNRPTSK